MAEKQDLKMDGKTLDITKENIAAMKQLFPEIVTDGKIDFEKLRLILGDEVETSDERYNFTWHGKNQAIRLSQTPSMGTLRPCKEDSVNWDTTKNLYIEGDNLEVLKLLQRSYFGKIKMIYIDPPYNTGKDFVYPDDYSDNLDNYLKITQQNIDDAQISTNRETFGRFHTNWLNMMYPRLKLASNLLRDDGVIFISMDDNELANLIKICNEIFGENNFKANISWQKRYTRSNNTTDFTTVIEHILVYSKSSDFSVNLLPRTEEADSRYSNPDNDPRGPWKGASFLNPANPEQRPNLCYPITNPNTGKITFPTTNAWRRSKEVFESLQKDNRLYWGSDGLSDIPSVKLFLSEARGLTPINFWDHEYAGNTDNGTADLLKIIDGKVFDNPKPVSLIIRMLEHASIFNQNDIILDFFGGSGTTAEAVLKLNNKDGGNRHFIVVQVPEPCPNSSNAFKAGFKTISEITKTRINRTIQLLQNQEKSALKLYDQDLGCRMFKLDSSNIRKWSPGLDLRNSLLSFENNLISDPGRTDMDVVFEILLKLGLDLNSNVEEKQNYYSVENGTLMICLKDVESLDVAQAMIDEYKEKEPLVWKVVFKDNGFASDDVKANTRETLKMAGLQDGSFITL